LPVYYIRMAETLSTSASDINIWSWSQSLETEDSDLLDAKLVEKYYKEGVFARRWIINYCQKESTLVNECVRSASRYILSLSSYDPVWFDQLCSSLDRPLMLICYQGLLDSLHLIRDKKYITEKYCDQMPQGKQYCYDYLSTVQEGLYTSWKVQEFPVKF
jgi:hypothetical protein